MKIHTVLGEIDPVELGATSCHEHVLWRVPEPFALEDSDLGFDSIPAAVAELRYLKNAGGKALVEMTTSEIGRSPLEYRQISIASEVHIIATTGHHKQKFNMSADKSISVDDLTNEILHDLQVGMDGTTIKAGVIKAATSQSEATDFERKVIMAAGNAHRVSGAPVSTHTEGGSFAIEQATLLLEAGVTPHKLLIGHLDRNLTWQTYLNLANMGVYFGFDQIGKQKYWSDHERVRLILKLLEAGFVDQIVLSTDTARKSGWHTHNPQAFGPAYLYDIFLPLLRAANVDRYSLEKMTVLNPANLLAF